RGSCSRRSASRCWAGCSRGSPADGAPRGCAPSRPSVPWPDTTVPGDTTTKKADMYQLHDLTKTYRQGKRVVRALRGVSLTIGEGELVAVQGPTGGGKSTLLQMLGGLDRPTSGAVS